MCKDGTIVPLYYFDDLFYLPYITPADGSPVSGGSPVIESYGVGESHLLSSIITADNLENADPAEAIVRLDARPAPENRISINPQISEICDGIDNNCDESIDESLLITGYADADSDSDTHTDERYRYRSIYARHIQILIHL